MGFLPSTGYGAGAGADMLQSILKQKADEAFRNQALQQESQRIEIERQRSQQQADLVKSELEARHSAAALENAKGQAMFQSQLEPGMNITDMPDVQSQLPSFLQQHVAPTLASTNLQGNAAPTVAGPDLTGMSATANPGAGAKVLYRGNAAQLKEKAADDLLDQTAAANPSLGPAVRMIKLIPDADKRAGAVADLVKGMATTPKTEAVVRQNPRTSQVERMVNGQWIPVTGDLPPGAHVMSQPPPAQDHFAIQPVTNADGTSGFVRINTQSGAVSPVDLGAGVSGGKPNQTLDTRLQSAKANLQVAADIKQQLNDPTVQADLGPLMGRANGAMNVIGNPPAGYAKLAGSIHSLALSSLAVHGMRSAEAARQIQEDLSLIHTPTALANYIDGLTAFGQHLLENNKQAPKSDFKVIEIK